MKSFILLFIVFLGLIASEYVVELTPDNFYDVIDGSKPVLVEFFAPWCGHCKRLAPEYESAAEQFTKQAADAVIIAKVDADAHSDLGASFGVSGFPTLKWFPKGTSGHGSPEDYDGGRDVDTILEWLNRKLGTKVAVKKAVSPVIVADDSNFEEKVLQTPRYSLVEFYAPWCGHCKNLAPIYEQLAGIYAGDDQVDIVNYDADGNRQFGGRYDVTGFPTLKWFDKDNKAEAIAYEAGRDLSSFIQFINDKTGQTRDTITGALPASAGRNEALDALAAQFLAASAEARKDLIQNAEALAKTANDKVYVAMMKAIEKRGNAFVQDESARISKLFSTSSVAPNRVDSFTIRKNILSAF